MRIIISGGNSRFAKELKNQNTNHNLILLDKEELNILNQDSIDSCLRYHKPTVFIHVAGLSRPMILHDQQPDKSIELNIIGTANCVKACMKYRLKFVYISTDYVYPGERGNYCETDGVLPVNKYAWSKLGGECAAMMYDESLILRMGMIEKPFPHKQAFDDLLKSCIWTSDAAKITLDLVNKNASGIFNVGGDKKSVYEFVSQEKSTILPVSADIVNEFVPYDASMDISKLKTVIHD